MTNVVLFMSDEHNPRFSSTYGHRFVRTPNLDRLAEQGTLYRNAYCPSPLCVPSRSAFMAGRHVHEIQRYNNCKVIESREPSYGGVLAAQGVHTAYLGSASNLYRDPFHLGFSEMLLVEATLRSLNPAAARRGVHPGPRRTDTAHGPEPGRFDVDIAYVDRAVEWLHRTAPGLDQPWSITVNVHPPHPPYTASPEYWQAHADHADLPEHDAGVPAARHPEIAGLRETKGLELPEEVTRAVRRGYYGMVSYVDAELGRVMDAVAAAGLADDTVIIYTTDHGEMLGKFGLWGKQSLVEDSVRVPVVAAGPGFTRGATVTTPVTLHDVQAALFHTVGARRPGHWQGQALQTLPDHDDRRIAFAEYHGPGVVGSGYLVRRGDWKLVHHTAAPDQLFNLAEDPEELVNLATHRPEVHADLMAALQKVCDPAVEDRAAKEFSVRQLAEIDRLRAIHGPDVTGVPWSEFSCGAG